MELNCSEKLLKPFPNTTIILQSCFYESAKENQLKPNGTIGLATKQICVEINEC